jgi:hypothetical protein
MGFYEEMQDIATGLLTEFKQGVVVLNKAGATSGSAWKPTPGAQTNITLFATVSGVSKKYVDKSLAIATDKQIICAVPSVAPTMADSVTIDGKSHKIVHIEPRPAAGTPAAYILIVRAA